MVLLDETGPKNCVVLHRNGWWVMQKALAHPAFRLK
jgi:hypothetical protein